MRPLQQNRHAVKPCFAFTALDQQDLARRMDIGIHKCDILSYLRPLQTGSVFCFVLEVGRRPSGLSQVDTRHGGIRVVEAGLRRAGRTGQRSEGIWSGSDRLGDADRRPVLECLRAQRVSDLGYT